MPSPAQTTPPGSPGEVLTAHLDQLAHRRGVHRAFTAVEFTSPSADGTHSSLTWAAVRSRALKVAARLRRTVEPGDRVALLLPQGLDYVAAFLGCLYARAVAVPLFPPSLPGHQGRLAAVLADCAPSCLATDSASAAELRRFTDGHPSAAEVAHLLVDAEGDTGEARGTPGTGEADAGLNGPGPAPDDVAYLQYTSGSTRTPTGVVITHANVVANARQGIAAYGLDSRSTSVAWLPLFHDMGLVLSVAAPVVGGYPSVLMDPVDFLQRPVRWLRLLARYPGAISAAPNFAYDYCASRVPPEEAAGLRLHRVRALINGSEPVRPATVERFRRAFEPAGLPPEAHCPSYGLAEATVFVCADPPGAAPGNVALDRAALGEGKAVTVAHEDTAATHLTTCGAPAGQRLLVVDPHTCAPLPEGAVGEIWIQGPNIGAGYWNRPGRTAETFGARAVGEDGVWLRTGDLGALHHGALLVTGRRKDLLIVDGRNHYPQDIEETVQSALPYVRRDRAAAFTVPPRDGETSEAVVVVAELARGSDPEAVDEAEATARARAAVSAAHGVRLSGLRLIAPGALPRTSSGKVARAASRDRYLDGSLT